MLVLVVLGAAWFSCYAVSVAVHPYRRCPDCLETPGRHWGSIFTTGFRACHRCGGRGRIQRAGAWLLRFGERDQTTRRIRGTREFD